MLLHNRLLRRSIIIGLCLLIMGAALRGGGLSRAQDPQPNPTKKIESNDTRVTQAGTWQSQAAHEASGGSYLYNSGAATLSLNFSGPSLEVIYVAGPSLGTLAIEVDGTVLRTVITTAEQTAFAQSAKIDYLTDEVHELKVYAQSGGVVAVDAFTLSLPISTAEAVVGLVSDITEARATTGPITLSEIDPGEPAQIEMINPHYVPMLMTGWHLQLYNDANALEVDFVFPEYIMFPGEMLIVRESIGPDVNNFLALGTSLSWGYGEAGAVTLLDASNTAIDFVRWGGSTVPAPFSGNFDFAASPDPGYTLSAGTYSHAYTRMQRWLNNACPTLNSLNNPCLTIDEVYYGNPVQVEIRNGSSVPRDLTNYRMALQRSNLQAWVFLPNVVVPAFGVLVLNMGSGTNTADTLYFNTAVPITYEEGGAYLYGTLDLNFRLASLAWNNAYQGTPFNYYPDAPPGNYSMARRGGPGLLAGDIGGIICPQQPTLYQTNHGCLVINEIGNGPPAYVELHNASIAPYPIHSGWRLDSGSVGLAIFSTLTIPPGGYEVFYAAPNFTFPTSGVVTLQLYIMRYCLAGSINNPIVLPCPDRVEYVGWGEGNAFNTNVPLAPQFLPAGYSIGRSPQALDTDSGFDFCVQVPTPNAANIGCGDTLALFRSDTHAVNLLSSLQDLPALSTYKVYNAHPPVETTNGQWVMGDWDGDGTKTPGSYATNGVFYYTNYNGFNTTWSSVWIGLLGRPAVTGRFDAGVNHDCIGAVDSANFPPHGTAFALYFTCDLTNETAPPLTFQWLSVVLPDAGGFSGTHQFAAGDFNNDGVDSIAIRRGEFIAFGNVPPTTLLSEFNLAQYWGVPPTTGGDYGVFLTGDFDNTAGDSFGVFYQNGNFYYRNAVDWYPGVHSLQQVGQPIGTPVQATSWR